MKRVRTTVTFEYDVHDRPVEDLESELLESDRVCEDAPQVMESLIDRDDVEVTVVSEVVES